MARARIKPANAAKLAAWLYTQHPALFRVILNQTQKLNASPLGRLGLFGDDADLSFTPDIPDTSLDMPDMSTFSLSDTSFSSLPAAGAGLTLDSLSAPIDTPIAADTGAYAGVGYTPTASDLSPVSVAIATPPAVSETPADTSASSGSFWSAAASDAGSVAGAVGKVAAALLSPAALTAAGGAAAAYFKAQAQTSQNNAQAQIVQAQLARTAAGYAPAPISYYRNPVTGQVTPVYASNTGLQPVTGSLLNTLLTPATAGGVSPMVWIGGGLLLLLALMSMKGRGV